MKKIVIAGANSFVASHFAHELLNQGIEVVALVRKSSHQSPKERMLKALEDTGLSTPKNLDRLTVHDYVLTEPDFRMNREVLEGLFEGTTDYFHFAASLKFDFQSRDEILETNVEGLRQALQLFHRYASADNRFLFISTAYSCGIFKGTFKEQFYPDEEVSAFRNYYEQSKRLAENVLRKYQEQYGIRAHVIRLSQVVGDSQTGVTRTHYGIFDFARRIHDLAREYPDQTIRIIADPDSTQNIIPIDTVVQDLIHLVQQEDIPKILNFVSKSPVENRRIIRFISQLLPIDLIPYKEIDHNDLNELEKMVLAGMAFTGNYIDTNIDFDTCERDKIISGHTREVSDDSLFRMLEYYLDHILISDALKNES